MSQLDRATDWRGRSMRDRDGAAIGTVESVYVDRATGRPEWARVRLGRFGGRSTIVPLVDVTTEGDDIRAAFSTEQVQRAPAPEGEGMPTEPQQAELYGHFGLGSDESGAEPSSRLDDAVRERLARVRRLYRVSASTYDTHAAAADPVRRRGVEDLGLGPGDVVIDAGCGTGLSFSLLRERVGPEGRIVGIDTSPEMLARARQRIERAGWDNVDLVEGPVEEAVAGVAADAVLLSFAHDVLRSAPALDKLLEHVAPGGRVAAAGAKWANWWEPGMNSYVLFLATQYTTTFEGLDRPWTLLGERLPDLRVQTLMLGTAYSASGHKPADG